VVDFFQQQHLGWVGLKANALALLRLRLSCCAAGRCQAVADSGCQLSSTPCKLQLTGSPGTHDALVDS
jgi:hypothetical protein